MTTMDISDMALGIDPTRQLTTSKDPRRDPTFRGRVLPQ